MLDIVMTAVLLCLMAYQVTGEVLHEWIGVGMTVLVIAHHVLNRRWYQSLFKGKYNAYRILSAVINTLLLAAIALAAISGMSMSGHAVPFLYGMINISTARSLHMAMTHWAFVLMGVHIGVHLPGMIAKLKKNEKLYNILKAVFLLAAAYGLFLFVRSNMWEYMTFRVVFAFFDFWKAPVLVFLEHLFMLLFWTFVGALLTAACFGKARKR